MCILFCNEQKFSLYNLNRWGKKSVQPISVQSMEIYLLAQMLVKYDTQARFYDSFNAGY